MHNQSKKRSAQEALTPVGMDQEVEDEQAGNLAEEQVPMPVGEEQVPMRVGSNQGRGDNGDANQQNQIPMPVGEEQEHDDQTMNSDTEADNTSSSQDSDMDISVGSTQHLDDTLLQANEQVLDLAKELETINLQVEDSPTSFHVVSKFRNSLKTLAAQANDLIYSLDNLHDAGKQESLFVDPDYRSNYWHSIEQVEFDDDYAPDQDGFFTVDDLLAIGGPSKGIIALRSIAQFHGFPHPDVTKRNDCELVAYLINLPRVSFERAKQINKKRGNDKYNANRGPQVNNTRKVRPGVIRTGLANLSSLGLNKYEVWLDQAEAEIKFNDGGSPLIKFDGIDANFLDEADVKKINGLTQDQKRTYVSKVTEACRYLRERATREERQNGTVHCVWNIQFWCKYAYWFAKSERKGNCLIWKGPLNTRGGVKGFPALGFQPTENHSRTTNTIHPALLSYLLTPNSHRNPYNQDRSDQDRLTISHLESNYECIEADHVVLESWALNQARGECMRKCASKCECQPACLHLNEQSEVIPCRQHPNAECP